MKIIGTVERVACPTRRSFDASFADPRRPVIVQGAIDDWPALARWDLDYLRRAFGETRVRCARSSTAKHPDFGTALEPQSVSLPFAELARHFASADAGTRTRYFVTNLRFRQGRRQSGPLGTLAADFRCPPLIDEAALASVALWLTAGAVQSWLHYDAGGQHNLNAQVTGRKRFLLFPPSQIPNLYLFPRFGAPGADEAARGTASPPVVPHHFSRVDVHDPDLARFPRLAEAACYAGELEAGDLLFIPSYWLHAFEHLGALNANVSFWWRPNVLELNPASLRHALFDAILGVSSAARAAAAHVDGDGDCDDDRDREADGDDDGEAVPAAAGLGADFLAFCRSLERACLGWQRNDTRSRA